jgi:hypothetical protein
MWSVRRRLLDSELERRPLPVETGTFIESGPPLRAFAAPSASLLN